MHMLLVSSRLMMWYRNLDITCLPTKAHLDHEARHVAFGGWKLGVGPDLNAHRLSKKP